MKPVLETSRLLLCEMSSGDLDFLAALLGDAEVMRWWPAPLTRGEAAAWIARQQERYARDGHGYWLALDKASGEPVGQAGLLTCEVYGVLEPGLGYIIHRPFWRRGLAAEAAAACRDWAFTAAGKERVIALIRPEKRTLYAGFEHVVYTAVCVHRVETSTWASS